MDESKAQLQNSPQPPPFSIPGNGHIPYITPYTPRTKEKKSQSQAGLLHYYLPISGHSHRSIVPQKNNQHHGFRSPVLLYRPSSGVLGVFYAFDALALPIKWLRRIQQYLPACTFLLNPQRPPPRLPKAQIVCLSAPYLSITREKTNHRTSGFE